MRELIAAAEAAGVKVQTFAARTPEEVPASLAAPCRAGPMGCIHLATQKTFGNPANFKSRQLIADAARKNRLPSMFDERLFVDAGGLVSYGPSYFDQFRRAATYVDKILKGAKPAELPVEQPVKFDLSDQSDDSAHARD